MERSSPEIVVVEDDADLRETVVDYLQSKGLQAIGLADGSGLRALFDRDTPPVIVILDIDLPGENGLSLCRWLSRSTRAGIILATGAGDPLDRIIGIETGADAYAVKPYDLRELVARIRALMRRPAREGPQVTSIPAVEQATARPDCLHFGPYRLDGEARRMTNSDGAEIRLTALEFSLALVFAERPNRLMTRAALAGLVQGRDDDPENRAIDVAIARLRRKLDSDRVHSNVIRTVRGEGYRYEPEPGESKGPIAVDQASRDPAR